MLTSDLKKIQNYKIPLVKETYQIHNKRIIKIRNNRFMITKTFLKIYLSVNFNIKTIILNIKNFLSLEMILIRTILTKYLFI